MAQRVMAELYLWGGAQVNPASVTTTYQAHKANHCLMIHVTTLRELTLKAPASPGRPLHLTAASGLVFAGDFLYVVADDEHHLGVFRASGDAAGELLALFAGELPATWAERKARKPDLEVLTRLPPFPGHPGGALLALPSGSTRNRRNGAWLSLDAHGAVIDTPHQIDCSGLCETLEQLVPALNIEGAVVVDERLRLLHRGSKDHPRSAIIDVPLPDVLHALGTSGFIVTAKLLGTRFVDLGTIAGIPLGFTDGAALPDSTVVFAAVAEDSENTYQDGPCVGAAVGVLDRDGRVRFLQPLDATHKVEGISAQIEDDVIRLLLVTDADEENIAARLLTAAIHGYPIEASHQGP